MSMSIRSAIGWCISKIIYEGNPWKKSRAKNFYSRFVKKGDLCFDVGAHLGDRSATWLNLGAIVVGIEPQPKFSAYLAKKFQKNPGYHNEQIALGATSTMATLHISQLFPTLSTLSDVSWRRKINEATPLKIAYDEITEVRVSTLDNMINKYGRPGFVKIDVEGYESEVLKGLSQPVDYVSFEVLSFNKEVMEECVFALSRLGYRKFNFSMQETFELSFASWVDAEYIVSHLKQLSGLYSGDVYARL